MEPCRPISRLAILFLCLVLLPLFAAAAEDLDVVRFGLFTDLHAHDVDSPLDGKWMTHTEERLTAFVDGMNTWGADFVIQLGDYVNGWVVFGGDLGDPARIPDILARTEDLYAKFDGPRYHVLGNHDVYNLSKDEYLDRVSIGETYYSFDVGAIHFIVLDVQFAEDGTDLSHTFTGVGGFVPKREIAWLREDLAASSQPTIVFVHQMLDEYLEEWGSPIVANQAEVQAVLEADEEVIAVFQGHDHDNVHSIIAGIHYVTFEALVDQGSPASWALVTLDPSSQTITIEGVGAQADYELPYARSE
ncbi:MAG: metallophosphoesterase [Candidatus Bipolaricaulia bacterium]